MTGSRAGAQYLLRVDDLCPTVDCARWQRLCALMRKFRVTPILAVVPDNRDPGLRVSEPAAAFWEEMQQMERGGATIALHGFQHLCQQARRSLVPLHREGEFGGAAFEVQRQRIRAGLRMLRAFGLDPKLFVAPRHNFDWMTLHALRCEGIRFISDGFTHRPFLRGGVVWIPQQLWSPSAKKKGLWTICVHPNTMDDAKFGGLEQFLMGHAEQFTSFARVLQEYEPRQFTVAEGLHQWACVCRITIRRKAGVLRSLLSMGRTLSAPGETEENFAVVTRSTAPPIDPEHLGG